MSNEEFDKLSGKENTTKSTQTLAWRAELGPDGVSVVVGPGAVAKPLRADTTAYTVSSEFTKVKQAQSLKQAAPLAVASWACTMDAPAQVSKPSSLKSYVGSHCDGGRPGQMRMLWWFDHSTWYGWAQYSQNAPQFSTSWTSAQAQGTDAYERCGNGGGTYNYRALGYLEIQGAGPTSSGPIAHGNGDGRYTCGTAAMA